MTTSSPDAHDPNDGRGLFTPAAPPQYQPEPAGPAPTYIETVQAEIAGETPAADGAEPLPVGVIVLPLAGKAKIRLRPPGQWRSSAMRAINNGDWDTWASMCLYADDYEAVWLVIDPTNDEVLDLLTDIRDTGALNLGELRASQPSLRPAARL